MNNLGNIEDSFKDAFSNWEPEHSAADMNKAWQKVSQHIPTAPSTSASSHIGQELAKSAGKGLSTIWKMAIISGIAGGILTTVLLHYNKTSDNQVQISQKSNSIADKAHNEISAKSGIYETPELSPSTNSNAKQQNSGQFSRSSNLSRQTKNPGTSFYDNPLNTENHNFNSGNNTNNPPVLSGKSVSDLQGKEDNNVSQNIGLADTSICESNNYQVNNESNRKMEIEWGDNSKSLVYTDAMHHYSKAGNYQLIIYKDGEIISRTVKVRISPSAHFSYNSSQGTTAKFQNISENASNFHWEFGDGTFDETHGDAEHLYKDSGTYKVKLIASHPNGCSNSIVQNIHVSDKSKFNIPNIFSPNGDGKNDLFDITMEGQTYFELSIYDLKMNLIFHSLDLNNKWNGNYSNGNACTPGNYIIILQYQYPNEAREAHSGIVRLNR
jgi:gliding motility-associated-like protein